MDYLPIYLKDHLAGATGGVELARRLYASNRDDARFGPKLERVRTEVEEDRAILAQVLDRLDVSPGLVKPAGAWVAEKFGRLKVNGRLRGYSPLSRLLELEGLAMGLTAKLALWKSMAALEDGSRLEVDFEQMAERARRQRATVDELHAVATDEIAKAEAS